MTDEFKLHQAKDKGAKARMVLENELIAEAFKAQKFMYMDAWQKSDPADVHGREQYWRAVQIIGDVQNHLQKLISNGKLAERELADMANKGRA